MKYSVLILLGLILGGCDEELKEPTTSRGFSEAQLASGAKIFKENCQVCHGVKARGIVKDWQKRSENGVMPAPPLNGTAHAWHHSDEVLLRTIEQGGIALGGTMPAFKDTLSSEEKRAVLTFIKSLWPDELYKAWSEQYE